MRQSQPLKPGHPAVYADIPSGEIVTAKQLAAHYKTSVSSVLSWYHEGKIPAEIAEGRVYRFDLGKVKLALAGQAGAAAVRLEEEDQSVVAARMAVMAALAEFERSRRGRGSNGGEAMVPTY